MYTHTHLDKQIENQCLEPVVGELEEEDAVEAADEADDAEGESPGTCDLRESAGEF